MPLPKGFPRCVFCGKPAISGVCRDCAAGKSKKYMDCYRDDIKRVRLGLI